MNSLDRAISIIQRELEAGRVGYDGLYSPSQSNYRNAWTELYQRINAKMNAGEFDRYAPIAALMTELITHGAPQTPPPQAINTTLIGREDEI